MAKSQGMIYKLVLMFISSVCMDKAIGYPFSASESQSCLEGETNPTEQISYIETINKTLIDAVGVLYKAQATKNFLLEKYHDTYLTLERRAYLDTSEELNMMYRERMGELNPSVEERVHTLKKHYTVVHTHIANVTAAIHRAQTSTPDLENLMAYLLEYKRSLSRCLCNIRLALIASCYTEQVSTNAIELDAHQSSIDTQISTAYVVINDGIVISEYLVDAYNDMQHLRPMVCRQGMPRLTRVHENPGIYVLSGLVFTKHRKANLKYFNLS